MNRLDHVSLSVDDGSKTAEFYRPILGQEIYLRPNTAAEYRIGVGASYLAINPGRNAPKGIVDHFAFGAVESTTEIGVILEKLSGPSPGTGDYRRDPDNTAFQVEESTGAEPPTPIAQYPKTAPVAGLQPVFQPLGLDQITLSTPDLIKSMAFYAMLCGPAQHRSSGQAVFRLGSSSLVLQERRNARAGIQHFRLLVSPFHRAQAVKRCKALGVELHSVSGDMHFADRDGIVVHVTDKPSVL